MMTLLALLAAQSTDRPPAPFDHIELAGGITVTGEDYLAHLYASIGSARLEELLLDRILAREAAALAEVPDERVRAILADPAAAARRHLDERVAADYGGSRDRYLDDLQQLGITAAEDAWATRIGLLRQARIAALVAARREPDPTSLQRLFEREYGVDGLQVSVRHVFVSFGRERARAAADHDHDHALGPEAIEARARQRIDALWARHLAGAPFHELASESDDPTARRLAAEPAARADAGRIVGYRFQRFGAELADVIRGMQPGETRGPVRSAEGYHIVRLDAAVRTRFADVEPHLRELLRREPPSLQEQRLLLDHLREKYAVSRALGR